LVPTKATDLEPSRSQIKLTPQFYRTVDVDQITAEYISKCVAAGLYNGTGFYRSDFVIQCGLHGTGKANPFGDLPVNETFTGTKVSNTRGTAAIAHFDVPDSTYPVLITLSARFRIPSRFFRSRWQHRILHQPGHERAPGLCLRRLLRLRRGRGRRRVQLGHRGRHRRRHRQGQAHRRHRDRYRGVTVVLIKAQLICSRHRHEAREDWGEGVGLSAPPTTSDSRAASKNRQLTRL